MSKLRNFSSKSFVLKKTINRFNVRCVAMVVDWVTNTPGTPLTSNVVKIGTDGGLCSSSIESGSDRNFHGQSSIASLEYISPTKKEHGNTLHISVC